jgi:hypothetical protein
VGCDGLLDVLDISLFAATAEDVLLMVSIMKLWPENSLRRRGIGTFVSLVLRL